jgi:hypothetical protein
MDRFKKEPQKKAAHLPTLRGLGKQALLIMALGTWSKGNGLSGRRGNVGLDGADDVPDVALGGIHAVNPPVAAVPILPNQANSLAWQAFKSGTRIFWRKSWFFNGNADILA